MLKSRLDQKGRRVAAIVFAALTVVGATSALIVVGPMQHTVSNAEPSPALKAAALDGTAAFQKTRSLVYQPLSQQSKTSQEQVDEEAAALAVDRTAISYHYDQEPPAVTTPANLNQTIVDAWGLDYQLKSDFTYAYTTAGLKPNPNISGSKIMDVEITVSKDGAQSAPVSKRLYASATNWTNIIARLKTSTSTSLTRDEFTAVNGDKSLYGPDERKEFADTLGVAIDWDGQLTTNDVALYWRKAAGSTSVVFYLQDLAYPNWTGPEYTQVYTSFSNHDLAEVQGEQAVVNALVPSDTYYFDNAIPAINAQPADANELAKYHIAFSPKLGFTYMLTVPALSATGTLGITILVSKGSTSGSPDAINVNAVRTNWVALLSRITSISSSSLTQEQFKAVNMTNRPLDELEGTLGIRFPLSEVVSAGTSLWWTKPVDGTAVTFDLYEGDLAGTDKKKLETVNVSITAFGVTQDKQDVTRIASALRTITTSTLAETAFKSTVVLDGTALDETTAKQLGIALPSLETGVSIKVAKAAGSNTVEFKVTKGTETENAEAQFANFATPVPSDSSGDSSPNVGAIVGGTVGGVAGAAGIAGVATYFIRRSKKRNH